MTPQAKCEQLASSLDGEVFTRENTYHPSERVIRIDIWVDGVNFQATYHSWETTLTVLLAMRQLNHQFKVGAKDEIS